MNTYRSLRALLAKEIRIIRRGLVFGLPICLLQGMTFLNWGAFGYVAYMATATLVLALAGTFVDYRFRVDPFFGSLPVRRGLLVAARYLWCALAVAAMLGVTVGEARLLAALGIRNPNVNPAAPLGGKEVILFLLLTALPLALFLPFCSRSGFGGGAARFGMAAGALAALTGGAAWAARRAGLDPAAALGAARDALTSALGPGSRVLVTVLALAGLGFASYLLSARFYERRDL